MTRTRRVTSSGWGRGTTIESLAGAGEHGGDVQHVLGLEPEVELLDDGLGEQLDQGRRVGQGGHRDPADQLGGDPGHGGDVQPHQGGHGPALDLHHHPLAGPEGGRVDLGDRGRGEGHPVEGGEDLGQGPTQVLFDGAADRRERLGRHPVAEQPELLDQLLGEDALAGGDDLAQLDVGRARGARRPGAADGTVPEREVGVPRSRRPQPEQGRTQPVAHGDHPAARGGGRLGSDQLGGPGAAASARSASMPPASAPGRSARAWRPGSTVQGPSGVKAPMARSGGRRVGSGPVDAAGQVGRATVGLERGTDRSAMGTQR